MLTNRATRLEVIQGHHIPFDGVWFLLVTLSLRRIVFEIFDLTLKPVLGSLKVIGIDTD